MKTVTIFITGGHLTPALATIEELKKRDIPLRIVFIGRSHATEHAKDLSHEHEEVSKLDIPFYPITTGRIQRFVSIHSIISLIKIPIGFFQALSLCIREKPSCIVSFGGYVALPVVLSGWLLRIPSISHEQTSVIGLANSIIARFAKKICVTFPETIKQIPKGKGVYTGLPIREGIVSILRTETKKGSSSNPVLYITGGSTGAASINKIIFEILPKLTELYTVIHQVGRLSFVEATSHRMNLSAVQKKRYSVHEYISSDELIDILKKTTLVIGRAGANTIIELATVGIPALLIPLPWSGGGEQLKNAHWVESNGSARVILQSNCTPDVIYTAIQEMILHHSVYQQKADAFKASMPHNGAKRFVNEILSLV